MKKLLPIIVFTLVQISCQEEVELELNGMQPLPVIEANWTNDTAFNKVKISYSQDYYDSTQNEVYKNAEVYIVDKQSGRKVEFYFEEQKGAYFPEGGEKGEVGHDYRLEVKMEGHIYRANGFMLEPPVLDSVTYTYKQARALRPAGYYLKVYGKIPFQNDNHYRIVTYKNNEEQEQPGDFLLFDDTFGTSLLDNGFELENMPFQEGDLAQLVIYRLNKGAYQYMNELFGIMFNDGGLFSPPPQNPTSNIELVKGDETALGYFLVSPVLSEKIQIKANTD